MGLNVTSAKLGAKVYFVINPAEGYRLAENGLRVKYKQGTFSQTEIQKVLTPDENGNYYFEVPTLYAIDYNGYTQGLQLRSYKDESGNSYAFQILAEFEPVRGDASGQEGKQTAAPALNLADNTNRATVADGAVIMVQEDLVVRAEESTDIQGSTDAGAAVNLVNADNMAEIAGGIIWGKDISVMSDAVNRVETIAGAGYREDGTGALAVQSADLRSAALVKKGKDGILVTDSLAVNAGGVYTTGLTADAAARNTALKAGTGAGTGVSVIDALTRAGVQDGVWLEALSGTALEGLTVRAKTTAQDVLTAAAGLAGGAASVSAAAVETTGAGAKAYVGKLHGDAALKAGQVTVEALKSA